MKLLDFPIDQPAPGFLPLPGAMVLRFLALVLVLVLAPAGFASADVVDVDSEALERLREEGVPVIDLRRSGEWKETGVIRGSHLMTFFDEAGKYDAAQWFETFRSQLDPDKPIVLICRSGVRSEKVAAWLSKQMNVPTVYNAKEGLIGWRSAGGVTVSGP